MQNSHQTTVNTTVMSNKTRNHTTYKNSHQTKVNTIVTSQGQYFNPVKLGIGEICPEYSRRKLRQ